jgi:hypothetical protein
MYILISYQLIMIALIFLEINNNSLEILNLNTSAKPISIKNIHLFGGGITSLILSLSKWQGKLILKHNPFKISLLKLWKKSKLSFFINFYTLSRNISNWFFRLLLRSIIILSLFLLPMIVMGYYIYEKMFHPHIDYLGMPFIVLLILILVGFSTGICGLILFSNYLVDFIEEFKHDIKDLSKDTLELISIIRSLLGRFLIQ